MCVHEKTAREQSRKKTTTELKPSAVVEIGSHIAKTGLEPPMPLLPEPGEMLVYSCNPSTGRVEAGDHPSRIGLGTW